MQLVFMEIFNTMPLALLALHAAAMIACALAILQTARLATRPYSQMLSGFLYIQCLLIFWVIAIEFAAISGVYILAGTNRGASMEAFQTVTNHLRVLVMIALATIMVLRSRVRYICERVCLEAIRDQLTGAYSRAYALKWLSHQMSKCLQTDNGLALLLIDVDGFKQINDTCGHDTGDTVLRNISSMLLAMAGPEDILGRLGGDEFVMVVGEPEKGLQKACQALQACESLPPTTGNSVSLSIGVAVFSPSHPAETITSLLQRADDAMYCSKREGGGRVSLAPPLYSHTRGAA